MLFAFAGYFVRFDYIGLSGFEVGFGCSCSFEVYIVVMNT